MKSTLTILIATFISLSAWADGKEIKVSVKGMVCGFCAQGITKKFKERAEVEAVDVSLEKKLVSLKTKHGQELSDKIITDILTESGYNIEKIDR